MNVECPLRSVKGLFQCTWCRGAGDPKLNGRGVGCQMTVAESKARCAPVNSKNVNANSIMQAIAKPSCQCSTEYAMCQSIVNGDQRSLYRQRPKSG